MINNIRAPGFKKEYKFWKVFSKTDPGHISRVLGIFVSKRHVATLGESKSTYAISKDQMQI